MSTRKLGIVPPPKERRTEIFNRYSFERVCDTLNGYLTGEVAIHSDPNRPINNAPTEKKKKSPIPLPPLTPNEELIESIALIGHRVIVKYCKNQTPHPGRVIVWENGLKLADKLEADQILPACVREMRIIKKHRFHCRIYHTENMGDICIPEHPGEKADGEMLINTPHHALDNPQWRISKGEAANVIMQAAKGETAMAEKIRCPWAGDLPIYIDYHDNEWGRPVHDDRKLFEMLILEGVQAGLSWITVLKKREAYREAFDEFDPQKVALYDDAKIQELLANEGIIRNRLKINAAVTNAKLFLEIVKEHGSFDKFIWSYVDCKPVVGHWESMEDMPLTTPLSDKISKDLKKMGFKFVGTTIIYSFMQAVGMVNDHLKSCFVNEEILKD